MTDNPAGRASTNGPSPQSGPAARTPSSLGTPTPANGQPLAARPSPERPSRPDLVQVAPRPSDSTRAQARVRGRIDIADEVVEKIAAAAAYEVDGVADLGGDVPRALERMRERIGIGRKRDDQNIGVDIDGGEAEIDVAITVKYGYTIVDVARRVQANVSYQAHVMLGLKVVAVNVSVDDIEMPEDALTYKTDDDSSGFVIET